MTETQAYVCLRDLEGAALLAEDGRAEATVGRTRVGVVFCVASVPSLLYTLGGRLRPHHDVLEALLREGA